MCGFKPLLLLLQTSRYGHKLSVEVISFYAFFRNDECIIVRTVFLSWAGLMNSSLWIIVIGRLLRTVLGVTWLVLLHRWFSMDIVAFGVDRSIDSSGALPDVVIVTGFGTASAPSLWFLPRGVIFWVVNIAFLGCIHHVYVV